MTIIKALFDRLLFTAGVLVFLQLPNFVDQYTQRMGGYYQAQVESFQQYQGIANQQFNGDMQALISEFNSSSRQSVKQTGNAIQNNRDQIEGLKEELYTLENSQFAYKVIHLITSVRYNIARETLRTYTPGVPFTSEALLCGLSGGIIFSVLFGVFARLPKLIWRKQKQVSSAVKQRIEPSVTRAPIRHNRPVPRPM